MPRCDACGAEVSLPFECLYCGGSFCGDHRLPPSHNCPRVEDWKARMRPSATKGPAVQPEAGSGGLQGDAGAEAPGEGTECYTCGVKTPMTFFCPVCGHDFCRFHRHHENNHTSPDQPRWKTEPAGAPGPVPPEPPVPAKPLDPAIVAVFIIAIAVIVGAVMFASTLKFPESPPPPPVTALPTTLVTLPPSPTPVPTWNGNSTPVTGTIFVNNTVPAGPGRIFVDNLYGKGDAVVILTGWTGTTPAAAVYIRQGENYTIREIGGNIYDLYVYSGKDWSNREKRFMTNPEYYKFSNPLSFFTFTTTTQTLFEEVRRTQYSVYNVTLYSVQNGTANVTGVRKENFPHFV